MMDPQIRDLLKKDSEERTHVKQGIMRIKMRQVATLIVGSLIFLILFVNSCKLDSQNAKQAATIRILNTVIQNSNSLMMQQRDLIQHQEERLKQQDTMFHILIEGQLSK